MTGQFKSIITGIRVMPGSGTPHEQLAAAAIDAASIDSAARHLLDGADNNPTAKTRPLQRRSADWRNPREPDRACPHR